MQEIFVKEKSLPEAYHAALAQLYTYGDILPCSDWGGTQKEASMTFVVEDPLCEPRISRLFVGDFRSLEQYVQEMCDGILDFEVGLGNWDYTYHKRFVEHMPFVINDLKRNTDSRRAVISIRTDDDVGSSSPACLQNIQFMIRNDQLHMKVLFRSNDAAKATFMNAYALIMLQKQVADELGVPIGTYTHSANSFHVYSRDFDLFDGYVKRILSNKNLTYQYEGDWDELMNEAKIDIAKMVNNLKGEEA